MLEGFGCLILCQFFVILHQELVDNWPTTESAFQTMPKAQKGTVQITSDRGWLRLRWSHGGRRFNLALGLPDTVVNRGIAQARAGLIYGDLVSGNFDTTLAKYRPTDQDEAALTVVGLFGKWLELKAKSQEVRSLEKFAGFQAHLQQYFKAREPEWVSEEEALRFRDWLLQRNEPISVRERVGWLRSCWNWGLRKKLVRENPWLDVRVKVAPKQKTPFTREEVETILQAFNLPEYAHYRDFAEFLLMVGCRPGEAIGLRWRHLTSDCSAIWIGESLGREKRQKPTKTGKERRFELTTRIQQMLLSRRPEGCSPDDLVFSSVEGKPIDDKNFSKRYWRKALEKAGVTYRRPYNARHSFVSIGVDQGVHPGDLAEVTGHSLETLYRNYLGSVRGRVKLPDIRGD